MTELEAHVSPTGVWDQELASEHHVFDYYLAKWIGQYLSKKEPVVDFGCGIASVLRYLHDIGFETLLGVEGTKLTNFEYGKIQIADLTTNVDVALQGNVICLEVAEHLPPQFANQLFENIIKPLKKGNKIIMSQAVPGQEGIGHVNCQHNIWVINQMEIRGLKCLYEDSLKARAVVGNHASWFRNTILIFEKL